MIQQCNYYPSLSSPQATRRCIKEKLIVRQIEEKHEQTKG